MEDFQRKNNVTFESWVKLLVPGEHVGTMTVLVPHANLQLQSDLRAAIVDLEEGGFEVTKKHDKRGDQYFFRGRSHYFRVVLRPGRESRLYSALVIGAGVSAMPTGGRLCLTGLFLISAESECDAEALARKCRQWHRRAQAAAQRLLKPRWTEADGRLLHGEIRRRYGALKAIYSLLQKRAETEGAAAIAGVVIAADKADPDRARSQRMMLTVRVERWDRAFSAPCRVEVSAAGEKVRAAVRDDDAAAGVLYMEVAEGAGLAPGVPVGLVLVPRFAWKNHTAALKGFLNEDGFRMWTPLATLLAEPRRMPSAWTPPQLEFFCEKEGSRLSEQQRLAVSGAVGTPHAYLIQGPPGTGKTTVISEIIRQLASRGERVLLLAPTHVAVDAVLHKIGNKPGVFPLRMAWNEDLVDEDLKQFTESRLRHSVVRKLAERADFLHRAEWDHERTGLLERIQNLSDWRETENQCRLSAAAAQEESAALRKLIRDHKGRIRSAEDDVSGLDASIAEFEKAVRSAVRRMKDAERKVGEAKAGASKLGKLGAVFGLGGLARVKKAAAEALLEHQRAASELTAIGKKREDACACLADLKKRGAAELEKVRKREQKAVELASVAEEQWKKVQERDTRSSALNDENGRESAAAECSGGAARLERLGKYLSLHDKWKIVADKNAGLHDDALVREILQLTNLFCATTAGVAGSPLAREMEFDTLIVDEASRVTDGEFLIGAKLAARWILVGDEKQLPPYVEQADEHWLHALTALRGAYGKDGAPLADSISRLGELWEEEEELHQFRHESVEEIAFRMLQDGDWKRSYAGIYERNRRYFEAGAKDPDRVLLTSMRDNLVRSLFERVVTEVPENMRNRLDVQRRMVPPLDAIVRDPVYDGAYLTPADGNGKEPLNPVFGAPLVFLDTSAHGSDAGEKREGSGFVCELEARWVLEVCRNFDKELQNSGSDEITVSILCFYRAQARRIRDLLGWPKCGFHKLKFQVIDAIDRIQGQESDLVIISFGRSRVTGGPPSPRFGLWLQDIRRLNVACTRARRSLVLVGHKDTLSRLEGRAEAKRFYDNLFRMVSEPVEGARLIHDYKGNNGGGNGQRRS